MQIAAGVGDGETDRSQQLAGMRRALLSWRLGKRAPVKGRWRLWWPCVPTEESSPCEALALY